jgi:metal-dependent amidase/aminoacylase/carboxypeptidase family protein
MTTSSTTSMLSQTLAQLIKADTPRLTGLRRELHKNPELSNNEHKTAKRIEAELRELGLTTKTGLATNGTGVIAYLPATTSTPCPSPRAPARRTRRRTPA